MNNFIDDITHQNFISSLYNLIPSELNTANSESLTSYLVKLAEAHCISNLLSIVFSFAAHYHFIKPSKFI